MTPDEARRIEKRLDEIRDDLRTIDAAHLDRYHSLKTDTDAVKLLIDGQRRIEAGLSEHDKRLDDVERVSDRGTQQGARNDKRLVSLEGMNVAVLADRLDRLSRLVGWLGSAIAVFTLSIIGGIVVYIVTQG